MNNLEISEITKRLDRITKLMVNKELIALESVAEKVRYLNSLGFGPSEIRDLFLPNVAINAITSYITRAKNESKRKTSQKAEARNTHKN